MLTVEGQMPGFWCHVGVQEGCEKISLGGVVPGEHYTMIWKKGERKIDVHITYDDPVKDKEKIFEISFFAANRIAVHLKKMESICQIYLKGRVTTMQRFTDNHKDWLLHPITGFGDEVSEWLKIRDRKLEVRKSMRDQVKATFLHPMEAAFYEGCHWQVYDEKERWRGFLFQKILIGQAPEFIYVSKYRHERFRREVKKLMNSIFTEVQYYSKYDLLTP